MAKQRAVPDQRNAQRSARTANVGGRYIERIALQIALFGAQIRRLDGPFCPGKRHDVGAAVGLVQPFRLEKRHVRRRAGNRRKAERVVLEQARQANVAPQMRAVLSTVMSKTGFNCVCDDEITARMSAVAVCCSNASERSSVRWRSSLSSRAFSMAITAWEAKVSSNSICSSEKGRTSIRRIRIAPIGTPSRNSGLASVVRWPSRLAS